MRQNPTVGESKGNGFFEGTWPYLSAIPRYNGQNFFLKEEKVISVVVQDLNESYKVYGWTIESQVIGKDGIPSKWYNHNNHKIYRSREDALDAVNQLVHNYSRYFKYNYRILPLYQLERDFYRNYVINKILAEKKDEDLNIH